MRWLLFCILAFSSVSLMAATAAAQDRPNVVFKYMNSMAAADRDAVVKAVR